MFPVTDSEIKKILGDITVAHIGDSKKIIRAVKTDSRACKKNALFIAIKGERFDGHGFIKNSIEKGAGAVISEIPPAASLKRLIVKKHINFIQVKDSIDALSLLAANNRKKSHACIIGITGSNGKTTTKDLLKGILGAAYDVVASRSSFNNHIGVPLTLLNISADTEYAVVEMGMNHKGELKRLTDIVRPDAVVITNIAESHMEYFKSKRDIALAKAEIFSGIKRGGYAVLNKDAAYYSFLKKRSVKKSFSFGENPRALYRISRIKRNKDGYSFSFGKKSGASRYFIKFPGIHNVSNASAAILVCLQEGMSGKAIKEQLLKLSLPKMRMEVRHLRENVTVINDAYNANPFSTEKAIKTLSGIETKGRRIMVFADMLELGSRSAFYHRKIGRTALKQGMDFFFCTGSDAKKAAEEFNTHAKNGKKAFFFSRKKDLEKKLLKFIKYGDAVLFKGSRGMKLEDVMERIK